MTRIRFVALAALALAAATPALASAFWPGQVIQVGAGDTLSVRKWPAAASQQIGQYNGGDRVSLTGRCKNTITNVSFRIDAGGSAAWKYSRMKRAHVWCQVMTEAAQLGWVRGKYVWPE